MAWNVMQFRGTGVVNLNGLSVEDQKRLMKVGFKKWQSEVAAREKKWREEHGLGLTLMAPSQSTGQ